MGSAGGRSSVRFMVVGFQTILPYVLWMRISGRVAQIKEILLDSL